MDIEIITVGGFNEVGRNMTAVRCGKEIVIFDMGLRLDQVMIHEDADIEEGSVKAIVCSHGHLDHIGAVPKLAHRYDAPIISTPYTTELIRQQIAGEQKFGVNNKLFALKAGQRYTISPHLTIEFVRSQHSIIDTVIPVLHTPEGAVIYANDFKLDRTPVLGEPPDFARLRQIGKEGVLALVTECVNIADKGRCPSEKIARDLVRDTITSYEDDKSALIVSTFSSHISRIKTIAECAHEIGRKPVLLGRSMERYATAAEQLKLVGFPESLSIFGNRRTVDRTLRRIIKTGTGAILTRMVMGDTPFKLEKGDKILFSARVIPNPMNRGQRYLIEARARMAGARIFDDLHVSGHAYREDHYEFVHLLNPQHIIPSHGDIDMTGYTLGNDLHLLRNGSRLLIK